MASPTFETEEMMESESNAGRPAIDRQAATPPVSPAIEHSDAGAGAAPAKRNGLIGFLKRHPLAAAAALVVVLACAVALWFYFGSYQTTDDAAMASPLNTLTARTSGSSIHVHPDVSDIHVQ